MNIRQRSLWKSLSVAVVAGLCILVAADCRQQSRLKQVQLVVTETSLGTIPVRRKGPFLLLPPGTTTSADGTRLACVDGGKGKAWVVVDGVAMREYGAVQFPVFSPNSKRLAYVARRGTEVSGKWLVVVNGIEGELLSSIVFSTHSAQTGDQPDRGIG